MKGWEFIRPIDFTPPSATFDLESVLRRRGHLPIKQGEFSQTLYPHDDMIKVLEALGQFKFVEYFGNDPMLHYLDYFGKSSFRKVARRLLRDERSWTPIADLEEIAGTSAEEYLVFLERLQMLERRDDEARLSRDINNLGPSLEHYVSEICVRELRGSAEWGVTLKELPRAGGDYDVLAWLDPSLVYVECKSGQPRNIEESELREFFQRSIELAPDLAILLVDSPDDLGQLVDGKMNPILRDVLGIADPESNPIQALPDYPRASFGFRRVYVTNSEKTIIAQLRRCLQHYYAHVKGVAWYSGNNVSFVGGPVRDSG